MCSDSVRPGGPVIVLVHAELGGSIVEDGTYPGLLVGGPADDVVLGLPARGRYTPSAVRLTVDGVPVKYFRSSMPTRPRQPALYVWDWDPSISRLATWEIGERVARLARHQWTDGPYAVPPRPDGGYRPPD